MISAVLSRLVILLFGTLYPAYASYKAVRTKNVKEYVKWMMYWIVFALFTCAETFTDVFVSWFPFYYEIKILFVLWLLLPATKGSSILYRKFVHPALCRREQEIDECIIKAKEQGYHTVLSLGSKGVNYATNVIMQTAIRGGGGLVQQIRKSYSLSDLTASDEHDSRSSQESDVPNMMAGSDNRVVRRAVSTKTRGPRPTSSPRVDMYFSEVDVSLTSRATPTRDGVNLSHIRSSEDITYIPENSSTQDPLTRTSSVSGARTRSKVNRKTFTSIKRPGAAEDNQVIIEEIDDYGDSSFYLENSDNNLTPDISFDNYLKFLTTQKGDPSPNESDFKNVYEKYLQFNNFLNSINDNKVLSDDKETSSKTDKLNNTQNDDKSKIIADNKEEEKLTNKSVENLNPSVVKQLENSGQIEDGSVKNTENSSDVEPSEENKKFDQLSIEEKKVEEFVEPPKFDEILHKADLNLEINKDDKDNNSLESKSNLSSDSEDAETQFATPNSSPVMKSKLAKHKKRHAPPPPEKVDDFIEKVDKVEENNLGKVEISNEVIEKDVEVIECSSEHIAEKNPKSKTKRDAGISKLLHLPTKLAFWNKNDTSEGHETSSNHSNRSSEFGSTVDIEKKLKDISSDINRSLASLRSMSDQFDDAIEQPRTGSSSNIRDESYKPYQSKSTEV